MQSEAAQVLDEPAHSYGDDCVHCGDGRPGTRCDLQGYSVRRVRFIKAHLEAYRSAYLSPNRSAASNEMARLEREYSTLPPRHSCSCPRLNPRKGIVEYHCMECRRLGEQIPKQDVAVEIGRTGRVEVGLPSSFPAGTLRFQPWSLTVLNGFQLLRCGLVTPL